MNPPDNAKKPAPGSRCEETNMFFSPLHCGRPAQFVIKNRDLDPYNMCDMCDMCADHNVKNRGARYVLEGE